MEKVLNFMVAGVSVFLVIANMILQRNNTEAMAILFTFLSGNSFQQYTETKKTQFLVSGIVCIVAAVVALVNYIL